MTELSRLYTETDRLQAACSWLLEQWLSDVDPAWAVHVLEGVRAEDPQIFATLDALNAEDEGGGTGGVVRHQPVARDDRATTHGAVVPVAGESYVGGAA